MVWEGLLVIISLASAFFAVVNLRARSEPSSESGYQLEA